MKLDDIKFHNLTYDLQNNPNLRQLFRRLLRLRYRLTQRRFLRQGAAALEDLKELEQQHTTALDADLLDWIKHSPEGGSTFEFAPRGVKLRLPSARRGEDIVDYLIRLNQSLPDRLK